MAARARHAPLALYAPTAWPQALAEGHAVDVKFTVLLAGGAATAQTDVHLFISGNGINANVPMRDDGLGPDLSAGDRVYSALFHFSEADAAAGRCYDARASAVSTAGQTLLSSVRRVCVTRFRVGIDASNTDAANVIVFTQAGVTAQVVADEVIIRVRPELGDDRIAALAALVDGRVVGSIPGVQTYQIRLSRSHTADELRQVLQRLQRAGGVLYAEVNGVGGLQAPTVPLVETNDDELLANNQPGLERTKIRQAWAITTGSATHKIAVMDTGANFDHLDFWSSPTDTRFHTSAGNLVAANCTGVVSTPSDVLTPCPVVTHTTACHAASSCNTNMGTGAADSDGHGTRTAGLIGAATNNSEGIAGVTWQGSLYIVKVGNSDATITPLQVAHGMHFANSQGARIQSISFASQVTGSTLCTAVSTVEASGNLVVAAAGNAGSGSSIWYPGSCAEALAVANTAISGSDDVIYNPGVAGGSNYGSWVDVAAPGVDVTSMDAAGGYTTATGTSFSTPIVAGAASLVLSRAPLGYTSAQLRTLLHDSGAVIRGTGAVLDSAVAHIRRIDVLAALLTFNAAPTAINLSGLCIPENTDSTAGASVGTLTTVDPDGWPTPFEYTIVGGADAAKFSIGGVNGDQLIITDGILNFEAKPSYLVTVRTTDVGDASFEMPFIVAVCNINEPPIVSDTTFTIPENSPAGTPVGTLVASDPDGGPLTFAISGGNTLGAFAIDGLTGAITVANPLALDYESTPGHAFSLTVEVSDDMNTLSVTVTVNLTDVPEAPAFTIYDNRASFLAALGVAPAQTQDFSGFAPGTNMQGVVFMPGVSATHGNSGGLEILGGGLFGQTNGPQPSTFHSIYDITISQTYHAFGFDVVAFDPATGTGTMQVFFQNGTNTTVLVANTTGSENLPVFFGVISSSPITRVTWSEPLEVGGTVCCEETVLDNFVANP